MKIGYFSSKFPYDSFYPDYVCGGSVNATYSLVKEMVKLNHDIKIFSTSKDFNDQYENSERIEIYRYGSQFNLFSSNISLGLFFKPFKYDVDLVHLSFDIPPGPFAGYRYAKKKNLPLVVTYHGDWEGSYGNLFRRMGVTLNNKLIVDKILSYAEIIISPSKRYAESSIHLKKYMDKINVIPNGVNLEEFQIDYSKEECRKKLDLPLEKNILLFFGYLSPYKSPEILLKAFARILLNHPDTLLLYAGSGEMMDELKIMSKKLKIEKNVKFAGFIGTDMRPFYYKASDIFCLPSTMSTECYPLAILESMASNLPVVSSEIGGIPDIIQNNINGLLFPPKNLDLLVKNISFLLENKKARETFSKNAESKIIKYSWENIAKTTERVYQKIIEY